MSIGSTADQALSDERLIPRILSTLTMPPPKASPNQLVVVSASAAELPNQSKRRPVGTRR